MSASHSQKLTETLDAMTQEAALQMALEHPLGQVHLSRIYAVAHAWQSAELRTRADVVYVTDAAMLREALGQRDNSILLVEKAVFVDYASLEAAIQLHPYPHVVFYQQH